MYPDEEDIKSRKEIIKLTMDALVEERVKINEHITDLEHELNLLSELDRFVTSNRMYQNNKLIKC
jgi:hypothetical protein